MDLSPDEMRILKKVLSDFKGSIRGAVASKMKPKEGSPEEEAGESPDMEKAEMSDSSLTGDAGGMKADDAANPDVVDATGGNSDDDEMEKLKEMYAQLKG